MDDVTDYSKQTYWESRFKVEDSYDWYPSRYENILELLVKKLEALNQSNMRILQLGCGNSKLGPDLYEKGFRNLTNIDYSPLVIEKMAEKYLTEMPEMKWETMDVRNLKYGDNIFDVIIDKAVMDTLQTDKASKTLESDINEFLSETSRVLKAGGKFYQITWEIPCLREYWTKDEKYNWEIEYEQVGEDNFYRIFTYTKKTT